VLDAYHGGEIPAQFLLPSFTRILRARLERPGGLILANVYTLHDLDLTPDAMATQFKLYFETVRLLDERGRQDRNVIVMAGAVQNLERPRLLMPPRVGGVYLAGEMARLSFRPRVYRQDPAYG
jgi:hypothetical protein